MMSGHLSFDYAQDEKTALSALRLIALSHNMRIQPLPIEMIFQ
jgi:hypothetical protein